MKKSLFLIIFALFLTLSFTTAVFAAADCGLPGGCTTTVDVADKVPPVPIYYDGTYNWALASNIGTYFDFSVTFVESATPANITVATPPDLNLADLTYSCSTDGTNFTPACSNAVNAGTSYTLKAVLPASPPDYPTAEDTISFSILQTQLTVDWASPAEVSFVFDGQPHNELEDSITYPLTITSTPTITGATYTPTYAYYNYVSSVCETTPLPGAPTNVGSYCVTATIPDDTSGNFLGDTTDPARLLIITQNQLVVDWTSAAEVTVVYDGLAHHELEDETTYPLTITGNPAITGVTYGTPTYAYYNYTSSVCETTPLAGAPVNVGSYCVAATIPDDTDPPANYLGDITDPAKILTITQNQLIVDWASPADISFVFDGQPHNELEDSITYPLTITSTPVISGGTYGAPTYAYYNYVSSICETTPLASAPTNVGTYCVAATIPDDTDPPANYLGGTTDPVKLLTITQNQLTVAWASLTELSIPYDGAPHAELEDDTTYPLTITGNPAITGATYGTPTYAYYNYLGSSACETTPLAGAPVNTGSYCVVATIPDDVTPPGNYLGGSTNPARLLTITPITDLVIEFNPTSRIAPYTGNPIPWNETDISLSSFTAGGPVVLLDSDVVTFNYYTDPGLSSPANFDLESGSKAGSVPVDAGTYYVTAVIDPDDNHNGATTALYAILTITPAETELKATWPADNVLSVAITVDNLVFPGSPISGTVYVYSDAAMTMLVASQEVSGTIPLTVVFENLPEGVNPFYVRFESTSVNFDNSEGTFVPGENTYFFTVTYDANGADAGVVPVDSTDYVLDATVIVAGNTGTTPLSRTGYFFGGWYRENDLTTVYGPEYTPSFEIIADTTMVAKWGFGIVYGLGDFAEGGTPPVDNKNPYDAGESFTILNNSSSNPIVREGYHFQKWNTAPDGVSGTDYFIGRSYIFPAAQSNLMLYPHWEADFPRPDGEPGQQGWYLIGDPRIPGSQRDPNLPGESRYPEMPHTGFSTRNLTALREQPAALSYKSLNIEIEVPVLNLRTELVTVPEDGGSWAVDWLGDRAGLLEGSVVPGKGTSYIAAHNHLNNMEIGPFLFILDLAENDRIFIRNEKEELLTYSVYANELYEPDDFASVKEKAAQYENSLVLITCENEAENGGYLNRRVVFAKPM